MVGYVGDIAYSLRHFMDVYSPSVPLAVEAGLLDRCVTASVMCVCVSLGNICRNGGGGQSKGGLKAPTFFPALAK